MKKLPLTAACADVAYDITRMQPQLFVARDFDQLFEVLDEFAATLSWKRGGDHGLEEARRARIGEPPRRSPAGASSPGGWSTRVAAPRARSVASGLRTALARLDGPVLVSRGGTAEGKPWPGDVVVAFGRGQRCRSAARST